MFSDLSVIVQAQEPRFSEYEKFTLNGKNLFFKIKCGNHLCFVPLSITG